MSRITLTAKFEWVVIGQVLLDGVGRPVFPKASLRPGLYRFEFEDGKDRSVYIGETDTLDRRFQHYRTPGPSQRTNLRLNALMRGALAAKKAISVAIVTGGIIQSEDWGERSADLSQKCDRILLEQSALYAEKISGARILNI